MYKNIFHYENNLNYLFCFLEGKTLYSWFSSCLKEELSKDVPGKMEEQFCPCYYCFTFFIPAFAKLQSRGSQNRIEIKKNALKDVMWMHSLPLE